MKVKKASTWVSSIMISIGLLVEYIALTKIIAGTSIDSIPQVIISISILIMLLHQFLVIKSFHSIDHLRENDLESVGLGMWVSHSRLEIILRILIFILFAGLTGEVVYLIITYSKAISYESIITYADESKTGVFGSKPVATINITWIPDFYIICAFCMSFVIMLWSFMGLRYERKELKKYNYTGREFDLNVLNPHPSSNIYKGFLLTDFLATLMWAAVGAIVIFNKTDAQWVLGIILLTYALFVVRRIFRIIRCYKYLLQGVFTNKTRSP